MKPIARCSVCVLAVMLGFAITPPASASDDAWLQEQINALGAEGGTVQLDAKTYVLRNTIRLKDFVTVRGAGPDHTIIKIDDGVNLAAFNTDRSDENTYGRGNHDVAICDLTIDGNAANNPEHSEGITLQNCYAYRIENVHVKSSRGFAGIITWPCHDAKTEGIPFKNFIVNCVVDGNQHAKAYDFPQGGGYGHGYYVTAWDNDNVLFRGNVARNNAASGIHGEDGISFFFVEDCESYDNAANGIWLCDVNNSVVRNCKIYDNGVNGIQIGQGERNFNNLIYGNEIAGNGYYGILQDRYYGPGDCSTLIVANSIRNNKGANHMWIADSASGNVIAFNFCDLDKGRKALACGVKVDSGDNVIINNYVRGATEEFTLADGNTLVPWDYSKPWNPNNLVDRY